MSHPDDAPGPRPSFSVALFLLAALGLLVLIGPAQAYQINPCGNDLLCQQREDILDEYYLLGTLTWNDKGGIKWEAEPESDGPAGPPPDRVADSLQYANSRARITSDPATIEFVSDPLPFDLWINVTRLIQLDLLVAQPPDSERQNTQPCTTYQWSSSTSEAAPDVKLLMGEEFVTGSAAGSWMNFPFEQKFYQQNPPGFAVCRYRMPAEVEMLPKGSRLTLQVSTTQDSYRNYQYGTSDEYRSILRIPYYSEDEVIFRYAELNDWESFAEIGQPGDSAPEQQSEPERGILPAGGLIGGVLGLALIPRRFRPRLLALGLGSIFVFAGLSGCMGAAGKSGAPISGEPTGGATSVFTPANGTALAGGGLGAIVGIVHDDLHLPVAQAHISVLGTSNATSSDAHGRFKFRSMAPGLYTLRVDRPEFRSLEVDVMVVKNALTRIDITLIPTVLKEEGLRAHTHDYWKGEELVPLFEDGLGTFCQGGRPPCGPYTKFRLPVDSKSPILIKPGTREVAVTISWDPASMGTDRVGLVVVSNNDYNGTRYYPRSSPATFRVQTGWEMTDVGHQVASTWVFGVYALSRDTLGPAGTDSTQVASYTSPAPQFAAKVTIQRGTLPLERPHPQPWHNTTSLPVDRHVSTVSSGLAAAQCRTAPGVSIYIQWHQSWTPQFVVPNGTKWLEVSALQSRRTGVEAVGHWDWVLKYRPADAQMKPFQFPIGNEEANNPDFVEAPAPTLSSNGKEYVWKIPITQDNADGVYSQRSLWEFVAYPNDADQTCVDTLSYAAMNPTATTSMTTVWTTTAHNEPLS